MLHIDIVKKYTGENYLLIEKQQKELELRDDGI